MVDTDPVCTDLGYRLRGGQVWLALRATPCVFELAVFLRLSGPGMPDSCCTGTLAKHSAQWAFGGVGATDSCRVSGRGMVRDQAGDACGNCCIDC